MRNIFSSANGSGEVFVRCAVINEFGLPKFKLNSWKHLTLPYGAIKSSSKTAYLLKFSQIEINDSNRIICLIIHQSLQCSQVLL